MIPVPCQLKLGTVHINDHSKVRLLGAQACVFLSLYLQKVNQNLAWI